MNRNGEFQITRTYLRPLIRYLGATLGFVIALPSCLGLLVAAFNPQMIAADPLALAFPLVIAPVASFATYRFLTVGGVADDRRIRMRGILKTVECMTQDLASIREGTRVTRNDNSNSRTRYYELFNHQGESLGEIPSVLEVTRDWKPFLARLRRLAQEPRQQPPKQESLPITDELLSKPVDQWTADDLKQYEREN